MRRLALLLIFLAPLSLLAISPAPLLLLSDHTINPGTADYLISGIRQAEREGAPYVILQLDTPGGLLSSTRAIVQEMLNAHIPVVVYVAPRGARAGSAGALLTFAADVAAMAPGTNIGAAHPVLPGEKMDKTMEEKITNDTAAFAEGLARSKGRNAEWAVKAVRNSESITADRALSLGVVDLIADDADALTRRLAGFALKAPKNGITRLPAAPGWKLMAMSIKHRVVSFFADPNLAYMIMALGGLCLWIELSHPGLVLPGILGGLCLIVSLVSFQMLPIDYGALFLVLLGMGLLISELFLPTYGVLGVGGLACFILGSLFLVDSQVPELRISLSLILPTAAVLAGFAFLLGVLVFRARRTKVRSGIGALVGEYAEVREAVSERPGKIFVQGELWNAISADGRTIIAGSVVVVTAARGLTLTVVAPNNLHVGANVDPEEK